MAIVTRFLSPSPHLITRRPAAHPPSCAAILNGCQPDTLTTPNNPLNR